MDVISVNRSPTFFHIAPLMFFRKLLMFAKDVYYIINVKIQYLCGKHFFSAFLDE